MKLMVAWLKRGSDEAGAEGHGLGAPVFWPGRVADPSRTGRRSNGGGAVGLCWALLDQKVFKNVETQPPNTFSRKNMPSRQNYPTESD
jgi:hypothetical protein